MKAARTWLSAALACLAMLTLGAVLDAHPTEAQDVADDAGEAVTHAQVIAARDALAQRICSAEAGQGAQVLWTYDGDLVCRPALHQAAKGGAL